MARFAYVARSASGERVTGTIDIEGSSAMAARIEALRTLVNRRGLNVVSLTAAATFLSSGEMLLARFLTWYYGLALRSARLTVFRSLAQFAKYSVPLPRGLGLTMASCPNPRLREALRGMLIDITDGGMSFADAMAARPQEFTALQTAMVRAGESGVGFPLVLQKIAELEERARRVGNKIQKALYYPAFVGLGIVGLIVYLVTYFIPRFAGIAKAFDQNVPDGMTRLARIGAVFANPISLTIILGLIAAVVLTAQFLLSQPAIAYSWDRMLNRVPFVGPLRRKMTIALVARLLGAMIGSGVPYDTALALLLDVISSPLYHKALMDIRLDMRANGCFFSTAASKTGLFDADFLALVAAGEESKSSSELLESLARDYDDDVERDLEMATTFIEPALIGILGGVVAVIIGVVYGSLYSMIGHIR